MTVCIRPLTADALRDAARSAAQQHIPLTEANNHEHGSQLWEDFNREYAEASTAETV